MNWAEMSTDDRDALVAERVMGWHRKKSKWGLSADWYNEAGEEVFNADGKDYDNPPFWPSVDIECAWLVVERMREDWPRGAKQLYFEVFTHSSVKWAARFTWYRYPDMPIKESLYAGGMDTAPEAICLAALRAKGVGV